MGGVLAASSPDADGLRLPVRPIPSEKESRPIFEPARMTESTFGIATVGTSRPATLGSAGGAFGATSAAALTATACAAFAVGAVVAGLALTVRTESLRAAATMTGAPAAAPAAAVDAISGEEAAELPRGSAADFCDGALSLDAPDRERIANPPSAITTTAAEMDAYNVVRFDDVRALQPASARGAWVVVCVSLDESTSRATIASSSTGALGALGALSAAAVLARVRAGAIPDAPACVGAGALATAESFDGATLGADGATCADGAVCGTGGI